METNFWTRIYQSRPLLLHVSTVIIYTAAAKVEVMDVPHIFLINAKIMSYQFFYSPTDAQVNFLKKQF